MILKRISTTATIFLLVLGMCVGFVTPAYAMDPEQRRIFDNGIDWFNYKDETVGTACTTQAVSTASSGSGGGGAAPTENQRIAYEFFVKKGLAPFRSAAIVGNLIQESGVNPASNQNGGGPGRGIAQWSSPGRWDTATPNLMSFASERGLQPLDLNTQLEFIWYEGNLASVQWGRAIPAVKAATNIDPNNLSEQEPIQNAVVAFEVYYEAAGRPNNAARTANANTVLTQFGNGAPANGPAESGGTAPEGVTQLASATTGGNGCTNGAGGNVSANCDSGGQAVTGKAAILCEAKKFDPFGYLWGGGHEDPQAFMAKFNAAGGYTQPFKRYLDCSGLERVAIYNATKQDVGAYTTATIQGVRFYRSIPIEQTVPGDMVHSPGHTEFVSAPGATATFGAHEVKPAGQEENEISEVPSKSSAWDAAYEYIGPDAGTAPGSEAPDGRRL